MSVEPIRLRASDGESGPAEAEIIRYGSVARIGRAIAFALGGLLGGAVCILFPVVHLITTWALPLGGIVLGLKALRTREKLVSLSGPCPSCQEKVQLFGGPVHGGKPRTCPRCRIALELLPVVDDQSAGRT